MLKAEEYVVSILHMEDPLEKADRSAVRLMEIKNDILYKKGNVIELIMMIQVMKYHDFLDHLYEITVTKKEEKLLPIRAYFPKIT